MDKQVYITIAICITIILSAIFITENTSFKQCIKEYSRIYPNLANGDLERPILKTCAGSGSG